MKTCEPLPAKDAKPARERARRDRRIRSMAWERKELMNGRAAGGMMEARRRQEGSKGSKSDGHSDKDKGNKK